MKVHGSMTKDAVLVEKFFRQETLMKDTIKITNLMGKALTIGKTVLTIRENGKME
jgi:hypothetical protein